MSPLADLETAAREVIDVLKTFKEFEEARIAIIGGLALMKHLPNSRTTDDVDFIVDLNRAPDSIKKPLLVMPNSRFVQLAQFFYHTMSNGSRVQIDFCPVLHSPYMPRDAIKIKDIPPGVLPVISPNDLIVFKVNSCGLRALVAKKRIDASDARLLLESITEKGHLQLTDTQQEFVQPGMVDMLKRSDKPEAWWREKLGLASSTATR